MCVCFICSVSHTCARVCEPMYVHRDQRRHRWPALSLSVLLFLGSFTLAASKFQWFSCLCLQQHWGYSQVWHCPAFYMGDGVWTEVLMSEQKVLLPNELSMQHLILYLCMKMSNYTSMRRNYFFLIVLFLQLHQKLVKKHHRYMCFFPCSQFYFIAL